jgi:hypothetical protein
MEREEKPPHLITLLVKVAWTCRVSGGTSFQTLRSLFVKPGVLIWVIRKAGTGNRIHFRYLAGYHAWMIETILCRDAGEQPRPD